MKKMRVFCLVLAIATVLWGIFPANAAQKDQSVISGCHSVDAAMTLSDSDQLTETAKAVLVYELKSDTMIYGWNADEKIYPASMVKLMTALVALENGVLEDRVVVTKRALSHVAIGSVSAGLVAGEELSLQDLLYCMMVASANDAATVIAEHIGGTQDGFIAMMNKKAAELGCVGTHYSNVHGLHDEQTYTTARDTCRILDIALENPDFKAMFTAKSYVVPATNKTDEERQMETSNYMMSDAVVKKYLDPRVTGGKTGATDEAGRCLAVTAEGGGMELLTIVMGAVPEYEDDGLSVKYFGSFEETAIILDYILENYEYRQIFHEGQTVSQFPVENGMNSVAVRPQMTRSTVLPKNLDESKLTWIYGDTVSAVTAPIAQGQKLSAIQVWYGAKCLAQADLVAANAVPVWQEPVVPAIPTEPENGSNWTVLLVIGGILAGAAVVVVMAFVIRRTARRIRQNARRRRRQMGRRRSR